MLKDKDLDRCIALWTHQNTLLWGRLQTVSAIQGAVLGGWYFLFTNTHFFWAFLLAALGTYLSDRVRALIFCDLDFRYKLKKEFDDNWPGFFPKHEGIPGWKIIKNISLVFVIINAVMLLVSVLFWWSSCTCPFSQCG